MADLILVRSMSRIALVLAALAVSSCATSISISGPFASHISENDIRDIRQLVESRPPNIERATWGRLWSVSFDRVDRARVELRNSMFYTRFVVLKRAGEWTIDKTTIDSDVLGWVPTG